MLELNDLSLRYKSLNVLENLSVAIDSKNITALIGKNGSGKSSLLRALMGLETLSTGKITYSGHDISQLRSDQRSQFFSLLEARTQPVFSILVKDLIELGGQQHDSQKRMTLFNELVAGFELSSLLERNALTLSSGELQRALLAHTLMGLAPLTFLDEPLTHLDWSHQLGTLEFLKKWSAHHGRGFLVALHELHWIPLLAQNVLVLGQRKILATGPAEKVFADDRVGGEFAFLAQIDENPLDGTKRLTLAKRR